MNSPVQHYQAADEILAKLDGEDVGQPYARALIAKAQVHALLATATVSEPMYDESTARECMAVRAAETTHDRL